MASTAPSSPSSSYSLSHLPSPTSTSRTSPPPIRQSEYARCPTAKDRLTTLPPELLLAVICSLPSSKSLLPLSQTNIYLQTFLLDTHASTICNRFITTRYSRAASILSATHRDGWYLPNHEAVIGIERRITREQIRKTGCSCVGCEALLRSASSSDLSLASNSSTRSCLKLLCLPASPRRPSHPETMCKAKNFHDCPWKLSLPGPMFLVFLERYDWEIQTRHIMLELECQDANEATREEKKRNFNFLVGNYSVRRFLEDVKRGFECEAASEQYAGGHEGLKSGVRRRLSRIMKRGWAKSQKVFLLKTTEKSVDHVTQYGNSAPPLFGEVQPQSGIFAVSSKHDRPLVTGLLWYYGLQNPTPQSETRMIPNGVANSDAQQAQLSPTGVRFQEKAEVSQGSGSDCMAGIKSGLGHVRSRIKQVFRRCKQVDAFHSLDD
ncbi:uncharacterized protein RSE6_03381 [Rhynchosporium secalis]|uniref:F-box domain-containing protein n=1 Tax=Rhynchosporium secalis TaxID=38038 RepID=A0A1E1M2L7_RHYSE|nr:uncharacterized protein RSE6_03381 [Rhynchosporium secalis]